MSREHLATYLNDHLAGAITATEVIERLIAHAPDIEPLLKQLQSDIESDQQQLVNIMARLGIEQSRIRKAGGWIAERLAQAKLEMDDESGGPFQRLERLEALVLGIEGKLKLWQALEAASIIDPELRGPDYLHLAHRAQEQHDRVEALRLESARSALPRAA